MMQSQARTHVSLSGTNVPTPLPVQLVVVSLPAGTSLMMVHVASPQSQPAGMTSPNSLTVVRRMKEADLTNGISDPTLDEIEVEYQCVLALRCAAGLQFPTITIAATSPFILHAVILHEWADTANKGS